MSITQFLWVFCYMLKKTQNFIILNILTVQMKGGKSLINKCYAKAQLKLGLDLKLSQVFQCTAICLLILPGFQMLHWACHPYTQNLCWFVVGAHIQTYILYVRISAPETHSSIEPSWPSYLLFCAYLFIHLSIYLSNYLSINDLRWY